MTTKRIALLTFLALGLSGCGVMEKMGMVEPSVGRCAGAACQVSVRVEGCRVIIEPETRVPRGMQNVRMIWTVVTANAEFASNGIDIQGGGGVFHSNQHQGKVYQWVNTNPGPGRFKYSVNVVQAGERCPTFDPFIVNL